MADGTVAEGLAAEIVAAERTEIGQSHHLPEGNENARPALMCCLLEASFLALAPFLAW